MTEALPSRKSMTRKALSVAWPAVMESFFIVLAGMIDTMMVAELGPYAVAATGLTAQPKFIGLTVFIGVNIAVSALICVLHWLCPSGPAVAGFAVAPIIMLAQTVDPNSVHLAVTLATITAFWSGVTFLLPTDAVPMFTYGFRYYTITDMVKEGWVPSLVFVFIVGLAVPFIVNLLNYA